MKRYIIKFWLPLAIASTILMMVIYASVQQNMRLTANDPQVQLAEDGATVLAGGMTPAVLIGASRVDMQKSLAPFVIIYNDSGKVLGSSGYLNNEIPILPTGVFDYARNNPDDRITWQPAPGVRVAAIVKHFQGNNSSGFIVSGRNLREVEDRYGQIQLIVLAGWVGLLVLTFIAVLYQWALERKEAESEI